MPVKVMTIVGTRPEIIKLSRVISELDKYTNHILVHSGQNYDYELNEIFFKDLGLRKIDYFLVRPEFWLNTSDACHRQFPFILFQQIPQQYRIADSLLSIF